MATEEELLSAIDANMDEDAPRLAHADWLEANGNAGTFKGIFEKRAPANRWQW